MDDRKPSRQNNRAVGNQYESLAADFLEKKGLRILVRNYRCRGGEIDLIARDGIYLVFVEVKYRKKGQTGFSLEAVDSRKQRVISSVARFYLKSRCGGEDVPCRFDVVGIDGGEITWIPNAFDCI